MMSRDEKANSPPKRKHDCSGNEELDDDAERQPKRKRPSPEEADPPPRLPLPFFDGRSFFLNRCHRHERGDQFIELSSVLKQEGTAPNEALISSMETSVPFLASFLPATTRVTFALSGAPEGASFGGIEGKELSYAKELQAAKNLENRWPTVTFPDGDFDVRSTLRCDCAGGCKPQAVSNRQAGARSRNCMT